MRAKERPIVRCTKMCLRREGGAPYAKKKTTGGGEECEGTSEEEGREICGDASLVGELGSKKKSGGQGLSRWSEESTEKTYPQLPGASRGICLEMDKRKRSNLCKGRIILWLPSIRVKNSGGVLAGACLRSPDATRDRESDSRLRTAGIQNARAAGSDDQEQRRGHRSSTESG